MGLEIAAAAYISTQCIGRDKVRSISDKIEVLDALYLSRNHASLANHHLQLLQAREVDMERLKEFYG